MYIKNLEIIIILLMSFSVSAQNVGVGTTAPPSRLTIVGDVNSPTIPGASSTGVFRVGVGTNDLEGIDFGKLGVLPFSAWMQVGYNGITTDPLALQPLGGNVGVGTVAPPSKLAIVGNFNSPTIPGASSTGVFRVGVGTNNNEGIDFGKQAIFPYSAWMQAGFNGTAEHLAIQPLGGSVGVGIIDPHPSAALDLSSTTKGLLPPRMTKVERDAIASPAEGLIISCTDCNVNGLQQYINAAWQSMTSGNIGNYGTVVNPTTGKVWLDRNLGAAQVAMSSTDMASYGDLYQWGRNATGHQLRTSGTKTTTVVDIVNTDSLFTIGHLNWVSPNPPIDMWLSTSSENNPCPSGFRVPSAAEWEQERRTWTSNDSAGAFASPLKLSMAGYRLYTTGSLIGIGTNGTYWSNSSWNSGTRYLDFSSGNALLVIDARAFGFSVRCIKD